MNIFTELLQPFTEFAILLTILLIHFFLLLKAKNLLDEKTKTAFKSSARYLFFIIAIGIVQIPILIHKYHQKVLLFQKLMGYTFIVWSALITCDAAVLLAKNFFSRGKKWTSNLLCGLSNTIEKGLHALLSFYAAFYSCVTAFCRFFLAYVQRIFDFIRKRRGRKIAIRFWGYWAFGVS